MRLAPIVGPLALAASCAHPAPPATRHAPATAPAPPPVAASPTARVVRHRAPEAAPAEFAEHAVAIDVDGDGRDDLVRRLPNLSPNDPRGDGDVEVIAPLLAHRLEDGRYALDDALTRAHLRALCPAPPDDRPIAAERPGAPDPGRARQALLTDGFCRRVWGTPLEAAVAAVRELARRSGDGLFPPGSVDEVAAALRTVPVPQALEALDAPPLARVPVVEPPPPLEEPAAGPACAAPNRTNAALLVRGSRAAGPGVDLRFTFGRRGPLCVGTTAGAWFIRLERFEAPRDGDGALSVFGALTWQPAPGPSRAGERLTLERRGDYGSVSYALVPAADYDGDGTPEVILRRDEWDDESGTDRAYKVYTLRGGEVRPYAPTSELWDIGGVVDADRDGRPDLVRASPWRRSGACGYMGSTFEGPGLLAHSLPDGTFSTTDEVARAWTLSRCVRDHGPAPALPDVLDVACARLRGASAESVIASLRASVQAGAPRVGETYDDPCLSFDALASVALQRLPFDPPARAAGAR